MRSRLPLEHRHEDRLQRRDFAETLASRINEAPFHRVVALEGPEGGGKTTVVNMTVESLHEIAPTWEVLRIDPVMFSGVGDELSSFLFAELSAQLGETGSDRLRRIASHLIEYGQLLGAFGAIPVVGTAFSAEATASRVTARVIQNRQQAAPPCSNSQREKLNSLIAEHGGRFLVVIDNLDRLTASEAAEVLRFVRTVADFPSTTYLLVYDLQRMVEVLADNGKDILDQLVPVTYHLPPLLESSISDLTANAIESATAGVEHGPFDAESWPELFTTSIRPLLRTPKDVKRYASEVAIAARVVGSSVALGDVLALEALRLFVPESFALIQREVGPLTGTGPACSGVAEDGAVNPIEALVSAAGPQSMAVREVCEHLFPAASSAGSEQLRERAAEILERAQRDRRVADPLALRTYLRRVLHLGDEPLHVAADAAASVRDGRAFKERLDTLDGVALAEVVEHLSCARLDGPVADADLAIGALLDARVRLPRVPTGTFGVPPETKLMQAVDRLLPSVTEAQLRASPDIRALVGQSAASPDAPSGGPRAPET